ncbi:MAG: exodeoxyribonuclease [Solirubrobacterales bacterium]|nr:exodeoxyribonuclease [Solirubrobacterales bacterium]
MQLVTWNVNSLKARLPRVLQFLDEHAPDVVCLQETKSAADAFPEAELRDAGYQAAHHSGGRWAGVAVLARAGLPISDVVCGLPGEAQADQARWVEASVDGVRVASAYVVNGQAVGTEPFAEKLAFLDAMATRAAQLRAAGTPLVIAGDMNVCPTDTDVYDPAAFVGATHVTDEERGALAQVAHAGGLRDAYRVVHPEPEQQFTWWDYRAGHFHKGLGLRIDLILASDEIAASLSDVHIERDYRKGLKPSDHVPLVARW